MKHLEDLLVARRRRGRLGVGEGHAGQVPLAPEQPVQPHADLGRSLDAGQFALVGVAETREHLDDLAEVLLEDDRVAAVARQALVLARVHVPHHHPVATLPEPVDHGSEAGLAETEEVALVQVAHVVGRRVAVGVGRADRGVERLARAHRHAAGDAVPGERRRRVRRERAVRERRVQVPQPVPADEVGRVAAPERQSQRVVEQALDPVEVAHHPTAVVEAARRLLQRADLSREARHRLIPDLVPVLRRHHEPTLVPRAAAEQRPRPHDVEVARARAAAARPAARLLQDRRVREAQPKARLVLQSASSRGSCRTGAQPRGVQHALRRV